MQQDVGRAGHRRRGKGPDNGIGGQRGPQHVGLEPTFQNGPRGSRQQLDRRRQVPLQFGHGAVQSPERGRVAQPLADTHRARAAGSGKGSGAAWVSSGSSTCATRSRKAW